MAEETQIKPIILTQEQINEYNRLFSEEGNDPTQNIANTVGRTLQMDYPELFTYDGLKDGTAGWFNTQTTPLQMPDGSFRSVSEMAPNERKLSDTQILMMFTEDEEGRPPDKGTFTKGFLRDIIPEGFGLSGAVLGAKTGYALQSPIPPAGIPGVALKLGIPTLTTVAGFFGAYEAGEAAADAVLGTERLILPEHLADYKSGKTAATVAPWMFFPFMVGKNISFGGGQLLDNIASITNRTGPLTASEMAQSGVASTLAKGKTPRTLRFIRGVENMLNNTRSAAYGAPKTTAALEAVAGYGAVRGRYEAERNFPGNEAAGVGLEIAGGLTPSLFGAFLMQKLPTAKAAIGDYYGRYKEAGFGGVRDKVNETQLNIALNEIRDQLEIEGYTQADIDQLIANLRDTSVDQYMVNEAGERIRLTAGQKAADPVLLALQASMERTNKGLGRQRQEANREALNALRGVIMTMAATGDKEMIKKAAVIQKELFDLGLSEELAVVSDNVLQAAERVGGTKGNRELSANLQLVTGNLLEEARNRERKLWSSIPQLEISEFKNAAGEAIDLPNFLTNWQNILPRTPEAAAEYMPKLRNLQAFVDRKAQEFGVGALSQPVADNLPELKKLDNLKTKIVGTNYEGALTRFKEKNADLSVSEQITNLRNEANRYRGKFSGKRGKDYAAVLDAEAEFLVASEKRRIEMLQSSQDAIVNQPGMGTLTVDEVQDMRSTALNIGRQALAAGDLQTARMAHAFADDLLADLESFPEGASAAYDMARSYSRSLNDTFTRAFAGDVVSLDRKGGQRIAPELLHQKLFTGGDDATYLRVEQLSNAAKFAVDEGLTGAESAKNSIYGGLEGLLRNARRETMDPDTGEINPDRLRKWISSNTGTPDEPKLLDFFPAVKEDLENAVTANNLLKTQVFENAEAVKNLRGQVTFMDLLPDTPGAVENPALVVARVMSKSSKAPMKSLNNLNRMISSAPDDMQDLARQGLRSGILEWAMTHSGGSAGNFSPRAAYEGLFEKIPGANSNTSIVDWALKNDVMSDAQVTKIKKVLTTMVKMEATAARGVDFDQFLADTGPMIDFYLRVAGSNMGQRVSGMVGAGSNDLIAAGAGSRALRRVYGKVFGEMPAALKGQAITQLFEDPEFLADMLEKPRTDADAMNLAKRLSAKLKDLGLTGFATETGLSVGRRGAPFVGSSVAEDEEEYVPAEPQENNPYSTNDQSSLQLPTPPAAQPTTALASAAPVLNQTVAPPPVASGKVDRSRFAAMFPEDRALIEGIGSLMG